MVRGGARTWASPLAWRVRWSCRSCSALRRVLQVDSNSSATTVLHPLQCCSRCLVSKSWSSRHPRVHDRVRALICHPREDPSRGLMMTPPRETCRVLLAHPTRLLLVAGTAGEAGQRGVSLRNHLSLAGYTSDPASRCRCSGGGVTRWGGCLEELAGREPEADCGLGRAWAIERRAGRGGEKACWTHVCGWVEDGRRVRLAGPGHA